MPLECLPDGEADVGDAVDEKSSQLVKELQVIQQRFIDQRLIGRAQKLSEAMEKVMRGGAQLRTLYNQVDEAYAFQSSCSFEL